MFCWGLLGFLAGIIFNKVELNKIKSRNFQIVQGPVLCMGVSLLDALGRASAGERLPGRRGTALAASWCLGFSGAAAGLYGLHGCPPTGMARGRLASSSVKRQPVGLAWIAHLTGYTDTFLGWKLYAFGALGLLIGLLIQRKQLPIDDLTLALFGFLTVFVIYGGIMNIATMVMASALPASGISISAESLAILYISGAPYDAVHALGTALFLFVFGDMMIRKLERIKIKYGFYR